MKQIWYRYLLESTVCSDVMCILLLYVRRKSEVGHSRSNHRRYAPVPSRFCPLRFLHRGTGDDADQEVSPSSDHMPTNRGQERPQMFGFGKHMCPGRELAKLEILLFLRSFLPRFDYDLVERQVGRSIRRDMSLRALVSYIGRNVNSFFRR